MNSYKIQYKVASVSVLSNTFDFEGYSFASYDPENYYNCNAWIASKEVQEKNALKALNLFIKDLMPIIEKCSVISQCAFRLHLNTYLIYKTNDNLEKVVKICYARPVAPVPLNFDIEEVKKLTSFNTLPNPQALFYLMEAANATTFFTRLTMLIPAAEALAGTTLKNGVPWTNSEELEYILGSEIYRRLYKGEKLRNKLLHGTINTQASYEGLTVSIYKKIQFYLNKKYNLDILEEIINPMRTFHDNFEVCSMFKQFINEPNLNLKMIEEVISKKTSYEIFHEYFGENNNY